MKKTKRSSKGMPIVHDYAAGIDIGSRFHVVAVPPNLDENRCSSLLSLNSQPDNSSSSQDTITVLQKTLLG